jgi:uncharacterized protein YyaL (SSP411 family)
MDADTPSANSLSATNLYRLGALLEDAAYASTARATVLAFEAEIEQWPGCFPGFMAGVAWSALGGKGVLVIGGSEGGVDRAGGVAAHVRGLGLARTVLRVRAGERDGWIKKRNVLLRDVVVGEAVRVMVCEQGVCREARDGEQVW